ncbi:MAG TPA: PEP-CTERM sorting domain-containing protein [Sedimentisphaerales bacterium]|nr:PEP-CTERM sorting domain-containing protein [Sedimentisphaerales bacterium]
MASRRLVSLCLLFAMAGNGSAYIVDQVEIEYWAGSGSNAAIVVIDFGVDSYAFGYRWEEGTRYGKDLMDAVTGTGALDYSESGGFLSTISYEGYLNVGENGWPTDWWGYFISEDGSNWAVAGGGFAERELSNGTWDGWAHQVTDSWPPAHFPTTPIPEPGTILLLALGGLFASKGKV